MSKWISGALVSGLLLSPTLAYAYCSQTHGQRFTRFEDAVNANIDYLLCLHNEQVTSLNNQAEAIDGLSEYITALDRKVSAEGILHAVENTSSGDRVSLAILRDVASRYAALEKENADLRRRVEVLEARQAD